MIHPLRTSQTRACNCWEGKLYSNYSQKNQNIYKIIKLLQYGSACGIIHWNNRRIHMLKEFRKSTQPYSSASNIFLNYISSIATKLTRYKHKTRYARGGANKWRSSLKKSRMRLSRRLMEVWAGRHSEVEFLERKSVIGTHVELRGHSSFMVW